MNEPLKSMISGMMVGVGAVANLSVGNKYIGALVFSIALFTIIRFDLSLYTGKVGYIPENKPIYIIKILGIFYENILGTLIVAIMISFTRIWETVESQAMIMMTTKIEDDFFSNIILAYFCGMLMYIAVENANECKKSGDSNTLVFGTVLPVMVFILCGFNHSIADSFYYFASFMETSSDLESKGVLYLLVVAVGNAFGCMTIPICKKLCIK